MFGVDVGLTEWEYAKMNVLQPVRMFEAVSGSNVASWIELC